MKRPISAQHEKPVHPFIDLFAYPHGFSKAATHLAMSDADFFHFPQGAYSGSCGLSCLSTVLAVLGIASPTALRDMALRKHGVAARVWRALGDTFFGGVDAPSLAQAVRDIELPLLLQVRSEWDGRKGSIEAFMMRQLRRRLLTMIALRSIDGCDFGHWCLGVGLYGHRVGRERHDNGVLLLDPSAETLPLNLHNARLSVVANNRRSVLNQGREPWALTSRLWRYEVPPCKAQAMGVTAAISFEYQPY